MRYDRSQEVVTVDPVLAEMIKYMDLDTNEVPEETTKSCNDKRFFDDYLSENRPVVLRGYSKDWIAMNKWSDLDYFKDKARGTQPFGYCRRLGATPDAAPEAKNNRPAAKQQQPG